MPESTADRTTNPLPLLLVLTTLLMGLTAAGPAPGSPEETTAHAAGSNTFGFELFSRYAEDPGNLLISPLSLSFALGMAYEGAVGETAVELARVLHIPTEQFVHHYGLQSVRRRAGGASSMWGTTYRISNQVFTDRPLRPEYLSVLSEVYGGDAVSLELEDGPEAAAAQINRWVGEATDGLIDRLVGPDDISGRFGPPAVLVNALLFSAAWSRPFPIVDTESAVFHRTPEDSIHVRMMHRQSRFPFAENDRFRMVALDYQSRQRMLIVLSQQPGVRPGIDAEFGIDDFDDLVDTLSPAVVEVRLPRFEYGYRDEELTGRLRDLGLIISQSAGADFSGLDGTRDLAIKLVPHAAVIEVDEESTSTAAAAGVYLQTKGGHGLMHRKGPIPFHIDRPFLFIIQDVGTGFILHLGRVTDPLDQRDLPTR